ncbi:hypothetical protein BH09VER1_BH09VER1_47430 [soil metagenome]
MALKTIRFTASHNSDYLHTALIELREAINAAPEVILLDIAAGMASPPWSILAIHDVLGHRDCGTKLITSANSPLYGPDCLLWLAGDHRLMVPSGYLFIPAVPETPENSEILGTCAPAGNPVEVLDKAYEQQTIVYAGLFLRGMHEAVHRMSEFMPVGELAGREIPFEELKELFLIGGELDAFLQTIGTVAPQTPAPSPR